MRISLFLILSLSVCAVYSTQYIPLSKTQYGLSVGDPTGLLHIQAFYDLACPDSKSLDTILESVFKTIVPSKNSIRFTYNMFPLPYHFYAFKITQGFKHLVNKSNTLGEQYIKYIFNTQTNYDEKNWLGKTGNEFSDSLAQNVSSSLGVSQAEFRASLNHGTTADAATRAEWKYGTSLGVSGTPIFYANGVKIDGADDWKYSEWINFFTKYVSLSGRNLITESQ